MKATIKSAKLKGIYQIFKKHKPQGLGFSDTDVIMIKLKVKGSKEFTQDFYCRIKADGTLGHSSTGRSEIRQRDLQNFIKKYISQKKDYNIKKNINKWKGKKVDVEKISNVFIIKM